MIQRREERLTQRAEHLKGGVGHVDSTPILQAEAMYGKGRLFNHVVLEKDCEVGWHVHEGDGEAYYILKGQGRYSDNGVMTTLRAGDVAFCPAGEGHSIRNDADEPMEMIALILYC